MTKYRSFLASKPILPYHNREERKSNRHNTGTMAHVNKFLLKLKPKGHGVYETQKFHNYMCKKKTETEMRKKRNET